MPTIKAFEAAWWLYSKMGWKCVPCRLYMDRIKNKKVFDDKATPGWKNIDYRFSDFREGLHNAIAVKTGKISNLQVIDLDVKDTANGFETLQSLGLDIPENICRAKTQSGGLHLFFEFSEAFEAQLKAFERKTTTAKPVAGVDLRGDGGLIFVAPTTVEGGGYYEWIVEPDPETVGDMGAFECVATLFAPEKETKKVSISGSTAKSIVEASTYANAAHVDREPSPKQRAVWDRKLRDYQGNYDNDRSLADFNLALTGVQYGIPESEITAALMFHANAKAKDSGQGQKYINATLDKARRVATPAPEQKSGFSKKPDFYPTVKESLEVANPVVDERDDISQRNVISDPPKVLPLNDKGNVERLLGLHGNTIRYCRQWAEFLVYDNKRFEVDNLSRIYTKATEAIGLLYHELNIAGDSDRIDKIKKFAHSCGNISRIEAVVRLAQKDERIAVKADQLDRNEWLLNVENGTLNLRGEIRLKQHDPNDLISKIAPVKYDPKANCPRWLAFLEEIFDGDSDLIRFIQKAVGYALTGDISEQCLFFLYGTGGNGKTKFLNTIKALLGEYAQQADPKLLLKSNNENHPTNVADLCGARFVVTTEVDKGHALAEGLVKQLTGGDTIKARYMFKDFFEFRPTHKIFMAANHKPPVHDLTVSIWRRILLIPFTVSIPKEKQDKYLEDKLRLELQGILNWALEGCRLWQSEGLQPTAKMVEALGEYRDESDPLDDFVIAECTLDPNLDVTASALYKTYLGYCEANADQPITKTRFGKLLKERGFASIRTKTTRFWAGIGLKNGQSADSEVDFNDFDPLA